MSKNAAASVDGHDEAWAERVRQRWDKEDTRAEFIQALVEDGSLIRVSEHHDDIDVSGEDGFGV